ncbi:hypothetical protein CcaverHIS002_0310930 [Cutaneotrichosporon cavernicola]|uniref:VPS9 domain-containing protein n=1 Tax=Cutaneotrichosporon cavernicola TaxID=279322 RepID=A0AA48L2Z8_9TREE|nr:uncharacterized protein CcaverHIS019_0310790 [Cutaneotrichosporon cavernicola]BEI83225.1 hypothetical protein CcaverHIS002_0310930 [Cutaneotrichosporon cavernicola]BEI91009.1 hypothetical protein CcaverHIS019_0310790 [Cutaneotrichosporon cavernicola]BEI98788.1 hypothetical protein CcaverHIS631_0310870 [Cutaneotrichosporon cavernicola]BEJ06559.1 hypothetical protein CcaverHIS641_0310810 [Cutaneotrichosporon cavernicola]
MPSSPSAATNASSSESAPLPPPKDAPSPPPKSPKSPRSNPPSPAPAPAPVSEAPLDTPAPHRTSTPLAPAKPPAPEPVLAPTPGPTPGPSLSLDQANVNANSLRVRPDLAEFDPYDTPAPQVRPKPPAGPGAEVRRKSPAGDENAVRRSSDQPDREPRRSPKPRHSADRRERRSEDPRRRSPRPEEPAFNFSGFLKDLRTKSADPVARYLKSFLNNFAKKPFTVNEQIKLIRDFLAFIEGKMRAVEPWKLQSEAEFDNALEAMEKLVMNRLYPYTFTPQLHEGHQITTDDLERDAVFAQRVRLFGWVEEKHLDVPEGEAAQGFLGFAEQELLKINHYKAPRDKMICILNCCKVIFGLIRHAMGNEAGADAFVPILIYVVLRASPDCMLSNVEYIQRFRNPEKLQGEAGYYLSSLQGAIAFIETMDASSLSNITQQEFESNVEKAIRELPESPSSPRARASLPTSDMSPFATSPGEEQAQQLALPASAAALDGTRRFFQRTGDAAKEAVSRPLSAITKILENMQQQGYDSESGDDEDGEHVTMQWTPGGSRDREADSRASAQHASTGLPMNTPSRQPQPQPPSRLLAQLGISPAQSEGVSRQPTPQPFPQPVFQGQYPGQQQMQQGYYHNPQPPGYAEDPYHDNMQSTLDASNAQFARDQARGANVLTLHQMFPALDEEIVEAVLYSCGEDLGVAIDRLLEM